MFLHCQSGKPFILAFKNLPKPLSLPSSSLSAASPHQTHLLQPGRSPHFLESTFLPLNAKPLLVHDPIQNAFLPLPSAQTAFKLQPNSFLPSLGGLSWLLLPICSSFLSEWVHNLFPEFPICHLIITNNLICFISPRRLHIFWRIRANI